MSVIGNLVIGASVNVRDFVAGCMKSASSLNALNAAAAKTQGGIAKINMNSAASRMNVLGTAMGGVRSALIGIGSAIALRSVVSDAIDLEKAMTGLAKATDLDQAGMEKLKQEMFDLSVSMKGVKLENLLSMSTTLAKMGTDAGDLKEVTKGLAMVSVAMDSIPVETIAEGLGKTNSVFKLGTQGVMQLGSAIDKLDDSGLSSAENIMNVTQRISGVANAAHITAQESTALAAALLDTGTRAEAAAGGINKLIMKMVDTSNHADFAKAAGVSTEKFASMVKDKPIAAIQLFLGALSKLDAASQLNVLGNVGIEGEEGTAEIMKLSQQSGSLAKYIGLANHEFETLDQLTKSYNANAKMTNASWDQMANKVQILKTGIGNGLLPAMNAGISIAGDMATGIGEAFTRLGAMTAGWGVDTGAVVDQVGLFFRRLPDFMDLGMIKVHELLINAGEYLSAFAENAKRIALWFGNNFSKIVADGFEALYRTIINLGKNVAALFASMKDAATGKGWHFDGKSLLDGFKATTAELPALVKPSLSSLEDQMLRKMAEIAEKEKKRAEDLSAAAKPNAPLKDTGKQLKTDGESEAMAVSKEMAKKAKSIYDASRTPFQKFQDKMKELNTLFKSNAIDAGTFGRAAGEAGNEFREDMKKRTEGPRYAAALTLGSQEARDTLMNFRGADKRVDGAKETARNTKEMADVLKEMLTIQRGAGGRGSEASEGVTRTYHFS